MGQKRLEENIVKLQAEPCNFQHNTDLSVQLRNPFTGELLNWYV